MHSAKKNPSEIEAFMKAWGNRHPVIIVPTKYYETPTDQFREWGVNMVIWANHNIRSSVKYDLQYLKIILLIYLSVVF
jgi:phosphoenolpyruvate phosphomutase